MKKDYKDTYERITEHIAAAIEQGAGDYQMPWHKAGAFGLPENASTHALYRGVNILSLWVSQELRGYDSNLWASYRQWSELGAHVRKGEKATPICFFRDLSSNAEEEPEKASEEETYKIRIVARTFWVFNANQVEGFKLPEIQTPKLSEAERLHSADQFLFGLGADIRHGGNKAFFSLAGDYVQLPPYERFKSALGYYSTAAHELTHWSGAESRLSREFGKRFGDKAYAAEELVAELGAAYMLGRLGLSSEPRPDQAQYIESWLSLLRGDSRAIFTAATKAGEACDFLHERHAELQTTRIAASEGHEIHQHPAEHSQRLSELTQDTAPPKNAQELDTKQGSKHTPAELTVHLGYHSDAECPCEWEGWQLYSFNSRHARFKHPDNFLDSDGIPVNATLRGELESPPNTPTRRSGEGPVWEVDPR